MSYSGAGHFGHGQVRNYFSASPSGSRASARGAVSGCHGDEPRPECPRPDRPALSSLISPDAAARPVLSDACCSSVYTNLLSLATSVPPQRQKAGKTQASPPRVSGTQRPGLQRARGRRGRRGPEGLRPALLRVAPPSPNWGRGLISISLGRCGMG